MEHGRNTDFSAKKQGHGENESHPKSAEDINFPNREIAPERDWNLGLGILTTL